ncbi:sulfur carrier protein ThiS [Metabacillus sp. GX 13764]|uniref:sulfur carrier protein ThiS n=1 Tax=Metabacillus kandeliae TaxID=2900151 RepID=UPI001E42B50D|nr:sulfur carrier protein ThiS [Metabacillus kandeliae]MCD7035217.1 sulfur carrier protein ThiS [Metabacillus kandeliae]
MRLCINGTKRDMPDELTTVADAVRYLGLSEKTIIVEQNGGILQKEDHENAVLKDEDVLEIVTFVGGG